jgi:hypothetical protein
VVEVEVARATALVPVSAEVLLDGRATAAAIQGWLTATPEDRARMASDAAAARQQEREAAGPARELTLDGLLDNLGFSREYAEHLMQPYCYCGDGPDGWDYCQHTRDLGLTP